MMTDDERGGWAEYRRLILSELERLNSQMATLNHKLDDFRVRDLADMKTEVAMLKVKAGLWGGLAGAILAIGSIATQLLLRL